MKKVFVANKTTGGHWAFQTEKARKPFVNPMSECKSIALRSDDCVVDIGAYVGEYSLWAASQGVRRVVSYEPTPATFELLASNQRPPMVIKNKAVVGDDRSEAKLFLSKGIGVTNSIAKAKERFIKVPAVRYENAIARASVVKIDCEGAEYGFDIIQPQLRAIILEFHPVPGWIEKRTMIIRSLAEAGFLPVVLPSFKSGWNLIGSWVRG